MSMSIILSIVGVLLLMVAAAAVLVWAHKGQDEPMPDNYYDSNSGIDERFETILAAARRVA